MTALCAKKKSRAALAQHSASPSSSPVAVTVAQRSRVRRAVVAVAGVQGSHREGREVSAVLVAVSVAVRWGRITPLPHVAQSTR